MKKVHENLWKTYWCVGKKCSYFMNVLNILLLQIANFSWEKIQVLKFIYCEKATKFEKIFHLFLKTMPNNVKTKWKIYKKFVAFPEYMKFNGKEFLVSWKKSLCPASYTQLFLYFILAFTNCMSVSLINKNTKVHARNLEAWRILFCSDLTFCKWEFLSSRYLYVLTRIISNFFSISVCHRQNYYTEIYALIMYVSSR